MSKAGIVFVFVLLVTLGVSAQQTTQYSQFYWNSYRYNPAFAGRQDCYDLKLGTRFQWLGFEGAPTSQFLSFNTPIVPKNKPTQRHGIGAIIEQDRTHITKRNTYLLSYAYHLRVHRDIRLSFGLSGGLIEYALTEAIADPALNGISTDFHYPEIFPGLLLYNKEFYLGISAEHLYPIKLKTLNTSNKLIPHVNISGGYRQETNYSFNIFYSAMFKWTGLVPPALHLNAQFEYSDNFILGLGYRAGDAVVATIKVKFLGFISLGYALDFPLNGMRVGIQEGHEGIIGISNCSYSPPRPHLDCPAYQ